jgi:hypothetical protein
MNQNIQLNSDANNKRTVQVAAPNKDKEISPADNFIQNQVGTIYIETKHCY